MPTCASSAKSWPRSSTAVRPMQCCLRHVHGTSGPASFLLGSRCAGRGACAPLQMRLQGSVALQVNAGPLHVAQVFLSRESEPNVRDTCVALGREGAWLTTPPVAAPARARGQAAPPVCRVSAAVLRGRDDEPHVRGGRTRADAVLRMLTHPRTTRVIKANQRGRQESLEEGYESLKTQLLQFLDPRERPYVPPSWI
jgi:choline dehydrogenase-like flavoprotein